MRRIIGAAMTALVVAGCEDGPFSPGYRDGWMSATVSGSVGSHYEGDSRFGWDYDGAANEEIFLIRSRDDYGRGEGIVFQRFGGGVPWEGRYWIGDFEDFFAQYERYENGVWKWYSADFGTIDIDYATSERIEGRFRFSAALTCVGSGGVMECDVPPPQDAPRVFVEGEFEAVRSAMQGAALDRRVTIRRVLE